MHPLSLVLLASSVLMTLVHFLIRPHVPSRLRRPVGNLIVGAAILMLLLFVLSLTIIID